MVSVYSLNHLLIYLYARLCMNGEPEWTNERKKKIGKTVFPINSFIFMVKLNMYYRILHIFSRYVLPIYVLVYMLGFWWNIIIWNGISPCTHFCVALHTLHVLYWREEGLIYVGQTHFTTSKTAHRVYQKKITTHSRYVVFQQKFCTIFFFFL